VPPRLFCDICDRFDVHDTEDCPTQAAASTDDDYDGNANTRSGAVRGAQREYCDTCEVFGHATGDCDESQTF
jgi:hypothetical protein